MAGVDGQHAGAGKQLADALKELQQRSGRTLRSLESEVMISDSSLSRYLLGQTVPPWDTVRDLCRALDADPADYLVLWKAADRCQPKPPGGGSSSKPAAEQGPPSWWRPWQRLGVGRIRGRHAGAVGGVFVGLVLGAALTWAVLLPGSPASTRDPAAAPADGENAQDHRPSSHDEVRNFVNRATGNCLDHSLDKGLRSFAPNGMSYQRWTVHPNPDGTSELRNHATGACLDSSGSGLHAAACGRTSSQKWSLTSWADESVQVRSQTTGTCLDDGGTAGLRAVPCNRSDQQKWG
ncbi:XRE family transcriptional regulator [Streptomyces sp. NBC_00190]|uniref:helix-turn-helix domain-containing protein n=1 Tax=unclassified Streptomyces TaxID=2593676 RepID=UPI002E288A72|nr:RICIN domain-containing protein [Streptomyces sp. NBC_00190]WSZ44350.1 XRE family transcriptional regulator [Streptomyces sp. NBC_00868]